MKEKQDKSIVDKNYFRAASYEFAGDIGAIDNEDMLSNKKLIANNDRKIKLKNKKM